MSEAPYRYTAAVADDIETRWQATWDADGTYAAVNPVGDLASGDLDPAQLPEKMFILDMFPYPSGKGLHVGHPLGYIATDVVARYHRMLGKNVLYTMGYDAFGLPAEQYAIQTGTHPRITTEQNIANMSRQLHRMGLSHDPRRTFATTDPEFVKWTQWIFLRLFDSWYDPDAPNVDGITGKARPIAELRELLAARTIDPYSLAERTNVQIPAEFADGLETDADLEILVNAFRLAYISDTPVNWCPGLGTVLSNEEVTADGRSERGNFPVFQRRLRQWNMRITAYADRLVDDLERVDWPEAVKSMQRNWIGRSRGAIVRFDLEANGTAFEGESFEVFTTRVDTLFGATFTVLSPEHELLTNLAEGQLPAQWPTNIPASWTGGFDTPFAAVSAYQAQAAAKTAEERTADDREKTGVFTGLFATNPLDGRQIPVFIADYVLTGYGTGAIMAVPAEDERDWDFAEAFDLPVIRTVQPPAEHEGVWTGEGAKINSSHGELDLNGLTIEDAKAAALAYALDKGFGRAHTTYRLRDWLFSRQRYWGEPFPIVYAEDAPDTPIALPASMLPVDLPEVSDFSPRTFDPEDADTEPQTPLSRNEDWVNVTLDLGDGPKKYRRETNTMPNWAGSSWYELRYADPNNSDQLADPANEKYWLGPRTEGGVGGADLYVGGVEHAVLHLLYARFWHKVLFDRGDVSSQEPFHKLFNQGYVQAYAYTDERGFYVPADEVVEQADGTFTYEGKPVTQEYGKMGKSLKNMVTPDEMYEQYGADTFRVYEMSMGPLDVSRPWETRAVVGAQRFLQRLWRLVVNEETGEVVVTDDAPDTPTAQATHRAIDGVTRDMEAMQFNTAISKLIELVNHLTKSGVSPRESVEALVIMVAPFAPHLAEELWAKLGHSETVTRQPYPVADPRLVKADEVTAVVQIKGKVRHKVQVDPEISAEDLEALVMAEDRVQELIAGQEIRKVIVRAPRIVNIVL